ncbi:MAG: hypothetical protein GY913_28815 [Proteobacteria bacterium]|nr:hypothetical protein [Pseudomonadota bacterium]MCP4920916.1 hypothetical protein [Pseudomonadota bacterium]
MSILNAWLFGPPAGATLFTHPYTIEELAERSEQVVVGEVLATRSEVRGGSPWTVATVMVEATLVGEPQILVEAAWPGGQMGDIELVVAGSPRMHAGQDTVVFLGAEGRVVGLSQGVLHVEDGVAWRDLSHLGFVEGTPEGPEAYSLEELFALVK